jgi:hypothetical protein
VIELCRGAGPIPCLRTFTMLSRPAHVIVPLSDGCVSLGASDEQSFPTALSVARDCADTGLVSCRCLYETLV